MEFFRAESWPAALRLRAEHGRALVPVAGGTDLMVELNFDRGRPLALLDLMNLPDVASWRQLPDGTVRIGATVPLSTIVTELATRLPGLAAASRTVGSPQIRNRATLGGNLGTASPAGDSLPALIAAGADVEIESTRGSRILPVERFLLGPKRNALADDELIRAVLVPAADGPQCFAKIGPRNAMVIALCSFALALHRGAERVGACIGSAGPTPIEPTAACSYLEAELVSGELWQAPRPLRDEVVEHFGALVREATSPIDDVRSTASYRRHAVGVLARRSLRWAWADFMGGTTCSSNSS